MATKLSIGIARLDTASHRAIMHSMKNQLSVEFKLSNTVLTNLFEQHTWSVEDATAPPSVDAIITPEIFATLLDMFATDRSPWSSTPLDTTPRRLHVPLR
jgi:hypothetical protein